MHVAFRSLQERLMTDQIHLPDSSISFTDIEKIDATQLPIIDRHYLRLMAHCLACFKSIANGASFGPFPEESYRLRWCLEQPNFGQDRAFISTLLVQLASAGHQLETLAKKMALHL